MKATTTPRKRKLQSGFTLVEVIVVAVIVAILAGVSVPLYLNYINNSRLNQATNTAGSAASYANACVNGGGTVQLDGILAAGGGTVGCTGGMGAGSSLQVPDNIILIPGGNSFTARHADSPDDAANTSQVFSYSGGAAPAD